MHAWEYKYVVIEKMVRLTLHVKEIHLSEKHRLTGFLETGKMELGKGLVEEESCDPPKGAS